MTKDEFRKTKVAWQHGRLVASGAIVALLLFSASCARSLRNPFSSAGPPSPDVLFGAASLDQMIAAVNANAQKIRTFQTNNASINIPGALGIPTLRGNIAAMRPGRVRLQASTALTGPEVDMGSNDELFWFWVRRNEPPQVYFARHSQVAGSAVQQLMPIDPQWLLDALGMAEFKSTDRHEGPLPTIDKNRVEIKSYVQSATGPMVKRTVIDAHKALVLEQHLYDGSGKLLASAVAKSHHYYKESLVSLPQVIEINIPPANLAMTIDVGTVELNRLVDNPQMWALPTIQGSPPMDLGAAPPADPGGGVPTMGNQITGADWYNPAPGGGAPSSLGTIPAGPPMAAGAATTAVAPWAPAVPGAPAPQFVPRSGVAQTTEPFESQAQAPQGVQRLPAGGVTTAPNFTR